MFNIILILLIVSFKQASGASQIHNPAVIINERNWTKDWHATLNKAKTGTIYGVLIIGASPYDDPEAKDIRLSLYSRNDVYLLDKQAPAQPREDESHFFNIDFNDFRFITLVDKALREKFHTILFDWSTFKFVKEQREMFFCLNKLLEMNGTIYIPDVRPPIIRPLDKFEGESEESRIQRSRALQTQEYHDRLLKDCKESGFECKITRALTIDNDVFDFIRKRVQQKERDSNNNPILDFNVLVATKAHPR